MEMSVAPETRWIRDRWTKRSCWGGIVVKNLKRIVHGSSYVIKRIRFDGIWQFKTRRFAEQTIWNCGAFSPIENTWTMDFSALKGVDYFCLKIGFRWNSMQIIILSFKKYRETICISTYILENVKWNVLMSKFYYMYN